MPVVLHGDAAFSGQGIVPEVMEVCYRLQHNEFDENQECFTLLCDMLQYLSRVVHSTQYPLTLLLIACTVTHQPFPSTHTYIPCPAVRSPRLHCRRLSAYRTQQPNRIYYRPQIGPIVLSLHECR